ncbi:TatD family hydrolase [Metabacillus idriensis]|uniref:TatD family hydrolase n=1 Tax=Metabacillus idriensis TaxID=324768 RepID=UPI001748B939|nr:TatD family hydrolase [Metabacillus idriensis]
MIDSHLHLDQYDRIDEKIDRWRQTGITGVVAVSTDLESSYRILSIKQRYPDFIYAAIGHHPEKRLPSAFELQELSKLIKLERNLLSAIGEIGLPHYEKEKLSIHHHEEEFYDILESFLLLGNELDLPVVLHAVHDEAEKALALLKGHDVKKAHFHWLKAKKATVLEIVKRNYAISVTPEICYRERDQELAKQIPLEQLLIETDGPWPYSGEFAGIETSPVFLEEICHCLANILHIPIIEIKEKTVRNSQMFYQRQNGGKL